MLKNFGYSTSDYPTEAVSIKIPQSFDNVYNEYNKLQLDNGFDLRSYCGKTVKRYTFSINNEAGEKIFANVLIYNGKVIGGDIMTPSVYGYMKGLAPKWKE